MSNKKRSSLSSYQRANPEFIFPQLLADLKKGPNQFHNLQHSQRRGRGGRNQLLGRNNPDNKKRKRNEILNHIFKLETMTDVLRLCP